MCWNKFAIHNLHVEYRRRGLPPRIGINTVSINRIFRGNIVLIKGDNGCGKTTLIKALVGEVPVSGGGIMLDDLHLTPEEFRKKCKISYVPQNPSRGAVDSMTVEENLLVRAMLHNREKINLSTLLQNIGVTKIQDLPLVDFLTQSKLAGDMRALSGGQLQVINLLSSLLSNPDFLFMDEPTSSMSCSRVANFWKLFNKLKNDDLVTFVTSHHDPYIEKYVNVRVSLKNGEVHSTQRQKKLKLQS